MGNKTRLFDIIPNFLLFFLFTGCMLLVLLCGAKSYQGVSEVMEKQFSVHTCISYVTAKVRHYDRIDAVSVGTIGTVDALILEEEINSETYLTYLYCADGKLMELFCGADMEFLPEDGQPVMSLDSLSFSMESGLLSVSCDADGERVETVVYLQSGGGQSE